MRSNLPAVSRRVALAAFGVAFAGLGSLAGAAPGRTRIEMWKGPGCACCDDWVKHMEANGFEVVTHATGNTDVRQKAGIPVAFGSCHTALVGGYAIEGHVPAKDVRRLLAEKPAAAGLAVPGMVIGSPGMDTSVYNGRKDPYDVLLVGRDGRSRVYASYR